MKRSPQNNRISFGPFSQRRVGMSFGPLSSISPTLYFGASVSHWSQSWAPHSPPFLFKMAHSTPLLLSSDTPYQLFWPHDPQSPTPSHDEKIFLPFPFPHLSTVKYQRLKYSVFTLLFVIFGYHSPALFCLVSFWFLDEWGPCASYWSTSAAGSHC